MCPIEIACVWHVGTQQVQKMRLLFARNHALHPWTLSVCVDVCSRRGCVDSIWSWVRKRTVSKPVLGVSKTSISGFVAVGPLCVYMLVVVVAVLSAYDYDCARIPWASRRFGGEAALADRESLQLRPCWPSDVDIEAVAIRGDVQTLAIRGSDGIRCDVQTVQIHWSSTMMILGHWSSGAMSNANWWIQWIQHSLGSFAQFCPTPNSPTQLTHPTEPIQPNPTTQSEHHHPSYPIFTFTPGPATQPDPRSKC